MLEVVRYDISHELGNAIQPIITYGEFNDRAKKENKPGPYENEIRDAHCNLIRRYWDIKKLPGLSIPDERRLDNLIGQDLVLKENRELLLEAIRLMKRR